MASDGLRWPQMGSDGVRARPGPPRMHVLTTALILSPLQVQRAWATRGTPGSPFSARHMRLRARMDAYLRDYVHDWSVNCL